jgi:hypothetical protein
MSGILDKKSRLFDYVLTDNGREQISRSEINYKYATVSDASIVYNIDFQKTKDNKVKVSESDFFYFPFESSISGIHNIVEENKIEKSYSLKYDFSFSDQDDLTDYISSAKSIIDNNISISNKIKNKKILLTKNYAKTDTLEFKVSGNYINGVFDFINNTRSLKYSSVKKSFESIQNIPILAFDKRLEKKTSYLKLIPQNSDGQALFQDEDFNGLAEYRQLSNLNVVLKNYNGIVDFKDKSDRSQSVIDIINELEKNKNIFTKSYELKDVTESDTFLLEMFEIRNTEPRSGEIEKLMFLELGDFYDNSDGKLKSVYLIGKIKLSRNNEEDIDGFFNDSKNLGDYNFNYNLIANYGNSRGTNRKDYILSSYYSFLNMFILVAE